jgi:hypothetical protein
MKCPSRPNGPDGPALGIGWGSGSRSNQTRPNLIQDKMTTTRNRPEPVRNRPYRLDPCQSERTTSTRASLKRTTSPQNRPMSAPRTDHIGSISNQVSLNEPNRHETGPNWTRSAESVDQVGQIDRIESSRSSRAGRPEQSRSSWLNRNGRAESSSRPEPFRLAESSRLVRIGRAGSAG